MHVQDVQLRVGLTGRYATALYKEALSTKKIKTILHDIHTFQILLKEHSNLEQILKNQLIRVKVMTVIIEEIGKLANLSEMFIRFLKIIAHNRRCQLLQSIFRDFLTLVDVQSNVLPIRIEITKTHKKHLKEIEKLLSDMYPNYSPRFEHAENPELLGGFRAFIQERCLDYSLRSRLNRLSYQLKEA